MNNLNVIDGFLAAFIAYIDSGFGLLGGDVGFLVATLIGIDITLAGLFWAMGREDDVLGRFARKILYIGAFAFIINNFGVLADIVFRSYAQAGLTAGGGTLTAADLVKPGHLAGVGFSAAWPLLDQASQLMGFTSFFDNFSTIAILLFAWALVIVAFFILAVQMFVTIIEFKLMRRSMRRPMGGKSQWPNSSLRCWRAFWKATVRLRGVARGRADECRSYHASIYYG